MQKCVPVFFQGSSLLSASDMRNIKLPVMQVALIFARDTWNSLIALVLSTWCCRNSAAGIASSWYCRNSAAKMTPSWCCRNSAAKLAASWARLTKLAASMVHIYQTCSKYGSSSHTWRISGSSRQYRQDRQRYKASS